MANKTFNLFGGSVVKQMYAYTQDEQKVFCRVERVFETGYIFSHYYIKAKEFSTKMGNWNPLYRHVDTHSTYNKQGKKTGYVVTYAVHPQYQVVDAQKNSYLTMQALIDTILMLNIHFK